MSQPLQWSYTMDSTRLDRPCLQIIMKNTLAYYDSESNTVVSSIIVRPGDKKLRYIRKPFRIFSLTSFHSAVNNLITFN